MGALKGRFQCLRGLRVNVFNNHDHKEACRWITIAIILHNLIIDVEGPDSAAEFIASHTAADEFEDAGHNDFDQEEEELNQAEDLGEAKWHRLTLELLAYCQGL
ncbi:hypothetical protein CPB84DRAFT_1897544 [Gymnopilus junonius]|uniref:DDE Tnp4 domain-containing protein n=1 Tax=Gymnopilus junonius TaxID=109634 RepID=A0A9P5NAU8_GYMJU|nr:hypothetical protein CPB84DRAFT_1897544 [Gymnopilus junonius]